VADSGVPTATIIYLQHLYSRASHANHIKTSLAKKVVTPQQANHQLSKTPRCSSIFGRETPQFEH
jgi:hypothetical protein